MKYILIEEDNYNELMHQLSELKKGQNDLQNLIKPIFSKLERIASANNSSSDDEILKGKDIPAFLQKSSSWLDKNISEIKIDNKQLINYDRRGRRWARKSDLEKYKSISLIKN